MKKVNSKPAGKESELKMPHDLRKVLAAVPQAEALWKSLTPIAHRDFVSWINEAKEPEIQKTQN